MYNFYQHEKSLTATSKSPQQVSESKRRQIKEALTSRFKTRVTHAVVALNQDCKALKPAERTQTPNVMRRTLISTGFLTETERVQEAENRSRWLDTTPNQSKLRLRCRDKSKEIQPAMKINLTSHLQRIEGQVKHFQEIYDSAPPPDSGARNLYKNYEGQDKAFASGGKAVLHHYHVKTYFKTIQSIALDLHSSTRNKSKADIRKQQEDEKLGMSEGKLKRRQTSKPSKPSLAHEDLKPLGEEVLEKFGYWKTRQDFFKKDSSQFVSSNWKKYKEKVG